MTPLTREDLEHVLSRTQKLWEQARVGRLFVTGGTGFFGRWVLETFCHAVDQLGLPAEAVVLTRDPKRFAEQVPWIAHHRSIRLHAGDMRSFEPPTGRFSHVIHAATETDSVEAPIDRLLLFDANTEGTRRILEFGSRCGATRLLYTSSGAVYGPQPAELMQVGEDCALAPDPLNISFAYGHSKRVSEFLCASYARRDGLHVGIARPFAFVGPHLPLSLSYAIGNFIRDALGGGPIRVKGDGTPLRSYLYAADLAIWLWTILFAGAPGRAYNVGSGVALSIADLARLVARVVNPRVDVIIEQQPVPGRLPARYVPGVERARVELGLEPWIALAEAIDRTVQWYGNCL